MVDEIELIVRGGDGGAGVVSFRHEKYVPFGGPDGGDGGKGGSVYLEVEESLFSLAPLRFKSRLRAEAGGRGRGKKQSGRDGGDLVVKVPRGIMVYEMGAGNVLLGELLDPGERMLVARGGRGGLGNSHFATPVDRAPRRATPGQQGEGRRLLLELRLVLDVAIIGCPNAGKSTLLSRLSRAQPKIAEYPFTTTDPILGIAQVGFGTFIIGEIPGLIPGAHEGRGLGDQFLRHIQRARLLVHLLDGSSVGVRQDLELINRELSLYSEELAAKPQVVVVNKLDLFLVAERQQEIAAELAGLAMPHFISAATGEGVATLLAELARRLKELPRIRIAAAPAALRPRPAVQKS